MFNFTNYFKSLFSICSSGNIEEHKPSLNHFLLRVFVFIVSTWLIIINHIFLLLDEILLFVYRFTPIKDPLMIIGVPRTGTTLLFRTMAEDKENFTCFTLGEILFAPSLIQKYLFYFTYRFDKLLGAPLKKSLLAIGAKALKSYDAIHNYSILKPEEDELILLHIYSTAVLKYLFAGTNAFDNYLEFDKKVSPLEKRNIFNFQRRCIKKHLFFWKTIRGKEKVFLSKNPIYSPKINSLFDFYPGLRLIVTNRNLEEVIPSFVSMNSAILKKFYSTQLMYPNAGMARSMIVSWQEQITNKVRSQNAGHVYECRYEQLTTNIKEHLISIYAYYGISMSETFSDLLTKKSSEQQLYKSRHTYNREELKRVLGSSDSPRSG